MAQHSPLQYPIFRKFQVKATKKSLRISWQAAVNTHVAMNPFHIQGKAVHRFNIELLPNQVEEALEFLHASMMGKWFSNRMFNTPIFGYEVLTVWVVEDSDAALIKLRFG